MGITRKVSMVGISSALLLSAAIPAFAESGGGVSAPSSVPAAIASPASKDEVAAGVKITRDEAVKLAREAVGVPEEYTVSNVHFNSMLHYNGGIKGKPVWFINFSRKSGEREIGFINVSIHGESGQMLQFQIHDNDPDKKPSYPPKTDYKKAKEIADSYLDSLNLPQRKETRYNKALESQFRTPLNGDVRYMVRYDRIVQGVPFVQNGINVEVDGEGKVVGFNMEWMDELSFEDAGKAISKEKALEAIKKEAGLRLSYFLPFESRKTPAPLLVYEWSGRVLDAVTGKPWAAGDGKVSQPVLATSPLAEKPGAPLPKLVHSLTKEEAISKITGTFKLPEGAKLEDASYSEYKEYFDYEISGTWDLRWSVPMPDTKKEGAVAEREKMGMPPEGKQVYAAIRANTGEVRHFTVNEYGMYGMKPVDEKEFKVTYADAKGKAIDLVKKLLPHRLHQLYLEEVDPQTLPGDFQKWNRAHQFTFKRLINGAESNYENVNIGIDRVTGEVTSLNNNLTNIEYPEKKPDIISAEKAMEKWLELFELELQYTYQSPGGGYIPYGLSMEKYNLMVAAGEIKPGQVPGVDGKSQAAPTAKLVYVPVPKQMNQYEILLDAVDGEWKNRRNGEKLELTRQEATDTDGHWAARELRLMVEYQALSVKDGLVNPDQAATRGEMIKMLMIAMNGGHFYNYYDSSRMASFKDVAADSPYFAYVEAAADQNLVDRKAGEFNPDAAMTREELAELIVRALGYNQLAKTKGLFQLTASDAGDVKLQGQAALAIGLGILTLDDEGRFHPEAEVTRAQAAVAFFRYLEKRAVLQERFYY